MDNSEKRQILFPKAFNQFIVSAAIGASVALSSCTSKQTESHEREVKLEGAYNVRDLGDTKPLMAKRLSLVRDTLSEFRFRCHTSFEGC